MLSCNEFGFDGRQVGVEGLVNPANGRLQHIGGLARAISDEAGPDLSRESELLVQRHGRQLEDGMAVSTGPGLLKNYGVRQVRQAASSCGVSCCV